MTGRNLNRLLASWGLGAGHRAQPAADEPPPVPRDDALVLSDAQWRERLGAAAYDVLRHEGTEHPFTSALNDEKRAGRYLCAGCGLALFDARAKFDSGTGWPSFFAPLPGAIETRVDHQWIMPRTEYHCARCGGHHGHVFNDGPAPTGQRHCNNGVALRFVPDVN